MYVIKKDGSRESVRFDKISERIGLLMDGLNREHVDPMLLTQKVIVGVHDGVTTDELDRLAAETAAMMVTIHPDYGILAARILTTNLHGKTSKSFSNTMKRLYQYVDEKTGFNAPLISKETWEVIRNNASFLDEQILHKNDFEYDFFGFRTLEKSYLIKIKGQVVERPQYMLMRVALGIHGKNIEAALETYNLLSNKFFTHATPTLFNAGTPKPQMSSCFLLTMKDDSIDGIYDTLKQCAKISQSAGGIGLAIHNVRAKGSYIRGTGGQSNGIVPMLRNFDMTARYVDQGGGKRKGSFAIYLEPWHADIFDFLVLKKNHGKEEMRARDLFYALWICDLFMQRVENNELWSLFCPNEAPGLSDVWGEDFERLYLKYELEGKFRKQVKAQDLWFEILQSQIETGTPYILYKDAANRKSNQKNLGTIKSSNLCTEIIQHTSHDEVAVCNLASLALNKFVKFVNGVAEYDHQSLFEVVKVVTRNLNKVIDVNYYPVEEARNSNMRHRPIGIGVQGLADAFILMRFPFESEDARQLNKDIFETIYFAALTASNQIAAVEGPYETYEGSPISKGILQPDMWGVELSQKRWDWIELKKEIKKFGVRNSLLVAPMPTASTSQILGNNECFEPYTSNIYVRRTISGEFKMVNKHLMNDLIRLKLWNEVIKTKIIAAGGSIQKIEEIPLELRQLYKTVWEVSQKKIIDQAADRGAYICQSQSMNIHLQNPDYAKLTSMHFYGWKKGLKTGMYYLRTQAAADAIQFTVDKNLLKEPDKNEGLNPNTPVIIQQPAKEISLFEQELADSGKLQCSIDNPDCEACGS